MQHYPCCPAHYNSNLVNTLCITLTQPVILLHPKRPYQNQAWQPIQSYLSTHFIIHLVIILQYRQHLIKEVTLVITQFTGSTPFQQPPKMFKVFALVALFATGSIASAISSAVVVKKGVAPFDGTTLGVVQPVRSHA